MKWNSIYFYGNEVSKYGQENGYVDYRTLSKSFDSVLNNNILSVDYDGFEQISGFVDNSDEIEELEERIEELEELFTDESTEEQDEETQGKIDEIRNEIEELEQEQDEQPEIFQYFIISDNGAEILKECNEIVFYNDNLDMYVWGVTHYGTSWDYVLTNIKIELDEK